MGRKGRGKRSEASSELRNARAQVARENAAQIHVENLYPSLYNLFQKVVLVSYDSGIEDRLKSRFPVGTFMPSNLDDLMDPEKWEMKHFVEESVFVVSGTNNSNFLVENVFVDDLKAVTGSELAQEYGKELAEMRHWLKEVKRGKDREPHGGNTVCFFFLGCFKGFHG